MRRAARQDDNHGQVREAFEKAGCTVEDTSGVGGGFADLLVGKAGKLVMVEVKDGAKSPSRRQRTEDEERFAEKWRQAGIEVVLVETLEQAIQLAAQL